MWANLDFLTKPKGMCLERRISLPGAKTIVSIFILQLFPIWQTAKSSDKTLVEDVQDVKELKKLLRVRTNVMILYSKSGSHKNNFMYRISSFSDSDQS